MSPFRTFTLGAAAALVVVLASAVPASAHDALVSSSPAEGARLDAAPTSVSLEFTAEVMDVGALILVVDADGKDWVAGDPTVLPSTVSVPLAADLPVGGYEVRWRVVSSDGHPIAGVVPFTVGDAEPLPRTSGTTTGTDPAGGGSVEDTTTQATESTPQGGGIPRVALIAMIGAAAGIAVFVGIRFFRRRHRAAGTGDEAETSPSAHTGKARP